MAAKWLIVDDAAGASLPFTDVVFGRVVSGAGSLSTDPGNAGVRDRVLSVQIQNVTA